MKDEFSLIVKIKSDKVNEKELFNIVQEILNKKKDEYPNFALISMIMDSIESSNDIFIVKNNIKLSELQIDFEPENG